MSFLDATALLFTTYLRRLAWSRRSVVCVVLAALAPVLALCLARFGKHTDATTIAVHVGFLLELQIIVPILALVAGSAAVAEEVEDRTITFLVSRPIPRAAILCGRYAAILVYLSALIAASAFGLLEAAAQARAHGPALDSGVREPLVAAALLGGAVYSALFAALGVFVRHPILVGLGYAFAIEGFLANMPAGTQSLTIQFYLRSVIAAQGSGAWNAVEGFASTRFDSKERALATLAIVLATALVLGAWRITRREFVVNA
ncbi:MAG: ABC transporter permease [Planctomycetota bacterium]